MKVDDGWWHHTDGDGDRLNVHTGEGMFVISVDSLAGTVHLPAGDVPGLISFLSGKDDPEGYDPGADWKRAKYSDVGGGITVETDDNGFMVTVSEGSDSPDEWAWTTVPREDLPSLIAKLAEGVGTEDLMTVIGCLARMMCTRVEENERNEETR